MNIFFYFLVNLTSALAGSHFGTTGYRMGLFVKHHARSPTTTMILQNNASFTKEARNIPDQYTRHSYKMKNQSARQAKPVRRKLCNAKTCRKCLTKISSSNLNEKVNNLCSTILTLRHCCPQKLIIRTGF